jgi:hypothetical protein
MNDEDCIVTLSSGPTTFRSTSIKPYFTEKDQENQLIQLANTDNQENKDTITIELPVEYTPQTAAQPPKRRRGRPRKIPLLDIKAYIGTVDT